MKDFLENLPSMVDMYGTSPKLEEMLKKSLLDKGIAGPTAAHFIEEIHSPLNLAYLTFTTGSSAFQNIVGVTSSEISNRITATHNALIQAGVKRGSKVLITYPPLVNVFTKQALEEYDLRWFFLQRSTRDAFLSALYHENPDVIVGESTFIKATLEDAKITGVSEYLPKDKIILVAGTPLDLDLIPIAKEVINSEVHDLYGCQEFGWLTLDGIPVREDISLIESPIKNGEYVEFVVGGLPMGDSFIYSESGHILNPQGKIITYRRERTHPEYEVFVKSTTLSSVETIGRVARTILRIKSRIVKVAEDVKTSAPHTILELRPSLGEKNNTSYIIEGPQKTKVFDDMVKAQLDYQQLNKSDPTWIKRR